MSSAVPGRRLTRRRHVRVPVQQLVAHKDPDTDAIFRLTRTEEVGRVWFDSSAPPALLPHGVMAPVNSQATVFHDDALWALLIPVSTTFRVCDIWRGESRGGTSAESMRAAV